MTPPNTAILEWMRLIAKSRTRCRRCNPCRANAVQVAEVMRRLAQIVTQRDGGTK